MWVNVLIDIITVIIYNQGVILVKVIKRIDNNFDKLFLQIRSFLPGHGSLWQAFIKIQFLPSPEKPAGQAAHWAPSAVSTQSTSLWNES